MNLEKDIGDKMSILFKEVEGRRVLKTPPLSRTESDLNVLVDLLSKIKFFKDHPKV